jgi:hypothetical protein
MAWQRNRAPQVARAGNDDVSIRFYVSDPKAIPPSTLRVEVQIEHDNGEPPTIQDFPITTSALTAPQRTQLRALLTALRDEAFSKAGYSDT